VVAVAAALLFWQARVTPQGRPTYVALGSSFAAGAGLGPLQRGSPWLCARSINGYPQQLARRLKIPTIDMSCGGAVTRHILVGGQLFQGPQVRVIDARTRLVTITVGGNDLAYTADLGFLAARNSSTLFGWLVRHLWSGPKPAASRDYASVERLLTQTVMDIRSRAPDATIVLATYPALLPTSGTCPVLRLSSGEAALMREVANGLAAATRNAARNGRAILVDMNALGQAHNACSSDPWTHGWTNGGIAPFHPTLQGAKATADAIAKALPVR
jgi:lysophospholipase L1-like esterase